MRKRNYVFLSLMLMTSLTEAFSQNYKQIEWDVIGISSLLPTDNDIGNAIGLTTEARYNLNDQISFGLIHKWSFFDNLFDEPVIGLGITASYGITADYHLHNNVNKRVFVGLELGIFDNKGTTELGSDVGGAGIGTTLRVGYEISFLRLTAKYNLTFAEDLPNYFDLGLGVNIGGRHKGI